MGIDPSAEMTAGQAEEFKRKFSEAMAAGQPQARPLPSPPAQRWQCAVCVSARRAWEAGHQQEIRRAIEQAIVQRVPAAALLPPELLAEMPPVMEAVTLAAIPGIGTAAVCVPHTPVLPEPNRRQLLVATAGMSMAGLGL
jgi:hypothetical protein